VRGGRAEEGCGQGSAVTPIPGPSSLPRRPFVGLGNPAISLARLLCFSPRSHTHAIKQNKRAHTKRTYCLLWVHAPEKCHSTSFHPQHPREARMLMSGCRMGDSPSFQARCARALGLSIYSPGSWLGLTALTSTCHRPHRQGTGLESNRRDAHLRTCAYSSKTRERRRPTKNCLRTQQRHPQMYRSFVL